VSWTFQYRKSLSSRPNDGTTGDVICIVMCGPPTSHRIEEGRNDDDDDDDKAAPAAAWCSLPNRTLREA
jgi:hypothetical protein